MSGKKILIIAAWFIFFINLIAFNSCTDDNLADLLKTDDTTTNNVVCDTAFTISYKFDIAPIIRSQCSDCHTEAYYTIKGNGIRLDAWEFLKIKASDNLLCAINQTPNACLPMPRISSGNSTPGPKIDNCYIIRIEAWIRQGMNNN